MRLSITLVVFLSLPTVIVASDPAFKVKISRHSTVLVPMGASQKKKIWSSNSGKLFCTLQPYGHDKKGTLLKEATLECKGPPHYKVQSIVDCSIHSSEDNANYVFWGAVGPSGENANMYLWCDN